MSTIAGTSAPASQAGRTEPADVAGAGGLLVVVEPPSAGAEPAGAALLAEGVRLARELGVELRSVTWPAGWGGDLDPVVEALADVAERTKPMAVLLADTDNGRQLAPLLAHRLGSGAVVGCSDILARGGPAGACEAGRPGTDYTARRTLLFVKPVYGGWLERDIEPAEGAAPVATLDVAGLEPESPPEGLPIPEILGIDASGPSRVHRLELVPPDPRSVDLVHARRIVAAGSGSTSDELLAAVRELAELLEGSVGATRPVVDDGHLPKERLIGQTGRTVTPELYLALGISGSPHHVAGVRRADRILSVNRDVRAPIFQFSDVGYVADLEAVLPGLVKRIKEWRDAPSEPR